MSKSSAVAEKTVVAEEVATKEAKTVTKPPAAKPEPKVTYSPLAQSLIALVRADAEAKEAAVLEIVEKAPHKVEAIEKLTGVLPQSSTLRKLTYAAQMVKTHLLVTPPEGAEGEAFTLKRSEVADRVLELTGLAANGWAVGPMPLDIAAALKQDVPAANAGVKANPGTTTSTGVVANAVKQVVPLICPVVEGADGSRVYSVPDERGFGSKLLNAAAEAVGREKGAFSSWNSLPKLRRWAAEVPVA